MTRRCPLAVFIALSMLTLLPTCGTAATNAESSSEPVTVRWLVGFGTGSRAEQQASQRAVVARFNATHESPQIELEIADWQVVSGVLSDRIDDGNAPDILGPVDQLAGSTTGLDYLDLAPWVERGEIPQAIAFPEANDVNLSSDETGAVMGLQLGSFPSMLFVNTDLFAAAGQPLPPTRVGEQYKGAEWDMSALRELAIALTSDANGRNVTSPEFDPDSVLQWGFHHQFVDDARTSGTFFGSGSLFGQDGAAQIPDPWLASWTWYHDLVWSDFAAPNAAQVQSPVLNDGDPFRSGQVAMAFADLSYLGSLRDMDGFDLAVVPSFASTTTAKLQTEEFRILASTEHPDEAVEVLTYLLGDGAPELIATYGTYPARAELREASSATFVSEHRSVDAWEVVDQSLEHPDEPSHSDTMTSTAATAKLIRDFHASLTNDPDLDVVDAAEQLRRQLDSAAGTGS